MRKASYIPLLFLALLLLAVSCASMGTPSGGPRDEDPPRFMYANPEQGATEVSPKKVVLTFDELVTLKDAFTKVVVSPPSSQTPRASSLGRRVTVEFRDTLLPNTTYTIDFGNAIADNNEGNQLDNFIYTFSTGSSLDSLMVSGMVLGAEDLSPASGMYVGLYSNLEDSAFVKTRFDRIAKTNDDGKFVIGGLAPGHYRIYALEDKDGNLFWSSPEEGMAFYDFIIEPYSEQTTATDTIFNLITGEVDSVVNRQRTRFLPNNILLRSYNTGYKQQYITKYERQDSSRINLIFNRAAEALPRLDFITTAGDIFPAEEISVIERSATNDTLSIWLCQPDLISRDTLRLAVEYFRSDSLYNPVAVNDTLRMITPRQQGKAKADKEKPDTEEVTVPTLKFKTLNSKPEVNQNFILELTEPMASFDVSMIHLEWKEDSIWKSVADFDRETILFDTLNPRLITIPYPWRFETAYRVLVDSLAGEGIYGLFTDKFSNEFTTRAESEYGSIKFNLSNMGPDSISRFVQLLDASGKPKLSQPLVNGSVTFNYLQPGKYNARVYEDHNANGKWDPGIFEQGLQPDISYYYKETIDLKANWDQEIDWNVFGTPVDKMIPESLRKKNTKSR